MRCRGRPTRSAASSYGRRDGWWRLGSSSSWPGRERVLDVVHGDGEVVVAVVCLYGLRAHADGELEAGRCRPAAPGHVVRGPKFRRTAPVRRRARDRRIDASMSRTRRQVDEPVGMRAWCQSSRCFAGSAGLLPVARSSLRLSHLAGGSARRGGEVAARSDGGLAARRSRASRSDDGQTGVGSQVAVQAICVRDLRKSYGDAAVRGSASTSRRARCSGCSARTAPERRRRRRRCSRASIRPAARLRDDRRLRAGFQARCARRRALPPRRAPPRRRGARHRRRSRPVVPGRADHRLRPVRPPR